MNGLTRFILVPLLLGSLLLSGCSGAKTPAQPGSGSSGPFSVAVKLTDSTDEKVEIHTAVPVFSGFSAAEKLNAMIKKVSDEGIAEVKKIAEEGRDSPVPGPLFYLSFFDYSLNSDVLSVWVTSENYTGGAHGLRWIEPFNLNIKTGEFYDTPAALFRNPEQGKKYLTEQIIDKIQKEPDGYFPDAVQTVRNKNGDFSFWIDGQNLVIFFDLYDIMPYVAGIPTFTFPLKELDTKISFKEQEPLGDYRLNGSGVKFRNPVVYGENGIFVPLEDTAAALGHKVERQDGKYTVDGKPAEPKIINGAAYIPMQFFTDTMGDFVIYDGLVLRMFTASKP